MGNPFRLLKSEHAMKSPKPCWKEFIKRCLKNKSFFIMEGLNSTNVEKDLEKMVEDETVRYYMNEFYSIAKLRLQT